MKFTYRGISYTTNSTSASNVQTQASGKYRGATWHSNNRKATKSHSALIYRGVHSA
ncbi:MAG: DUF4278 domain-containing protein [Spirulina sp.]